MFAAIRAGHALHTEFAAKILEELRRHDPTNIQVLRLLGRAYLRNKQFDQALAAMQEILAKQPGAPQ